MNPTFNLYLQNRPLKEVFIINSESSDALSYIDQVITYCQDKWGGGYNQIILINNDDISDDWLSYLYAYDPDIIKIFEELPQKVTDKINYNINYILIEDFNTRGYKTSGLTIFPQKHNIYNKKLILFKKKSRVELTTDLTNFIKYNFGWYYGLQYEENLLNQIDNKEIVLIESENDLIKFFEEQLGKYGLNFNQRFQAQISSHANNHFSETSNRIYDRHITVYVGNSINNFVKFWNSSLRLDSFHQEFFHKLYLPINLLASDAFLKSLLEWLKRYSDIDNGRNTQDIKFESYDLSEDEISLVNIQLAKFSKYKCVNLDFTVERPKGLNRCTYEFPSLNEPYFGIQDFEPKQNVELHNISKEGCSTITTNRPTNNIANKNEFYISDLYIQEFSNSGLLRVPKRLKNMGKLIAPNNMSKVNCTNQVSLLRRFGDRALNVTYPKEEKLLKKILSDYQYNKTNYKITNYQISDKGLYLKGLLDIFKNIYILQDYIGNSYWDEIFKILSGINDKTDQSNLHSLKNKLKKHIGEIENSFLSSEDGIIYLSNLITDLAKGYNENTKGISFKTFYNIAKKYFDKYSESEEFQDIRDEDSNIIFSEDALKESLNFLLEMGVLQLGTTIKCSKCGTYQWYSIKNLNSKVQCAGCDEYIVAKAELQWRYKLNTIVTTAYKHDIIPVALTLQHLHSSARQSFMYMPSQEIYVDKQQTPFTDLDIICIVDGIFIIGEVKKSQKNFKSCDFDKLITVAKILKPDRVIVSALDITYQNNKSKVLLEGVDRMLNELSKYNIDVDILEFHTDPIGLDCEPFTNIEIK